MDETLLELPDGRQFSDFDCGAAATQAILAYYGIDIREDKLMAEMKTNTETGTAVKEIVKMFEKYNLKTIVRQNMTISDIKVHLTEGHPVIVPIQAWALDINTVDWKADKDDGHYLILIGFKEDKILIEDPSLFGRGYLTEYELDARWHDYDADGTLLDHFGIVVIGDPVYNDEKFIHVD